MDFPVYSFEEFLDLGRQHPVAPGACPCGAAAPLLGIACSVTPKPGPCGLPAPGPCSAAHARRSQHDHVGLHLARSACCTPPPPLLLLICSSPPPPPCT